MAIKDYGPIVITSVIMTTFLLLIIDSDMTNSKREEAIERLGCEVEWLYDERVCQIDNEYLFVDVDCSGWFFNKECSAQIVSVGDYRIKN